jgi:hypothetical protein
MNKARWTGGMRAAGFAPTDRNTQRQPPRPIKHAFLCTRRGHGNTQVETHACGSATRPPLSALPLCEPRMGRIAFKACASRFAFDVMSSGNAARSLPLSRWIAPRAIGSPVDGSRLRVISTVVLTALASATWFLTLKESGSGTDCHHDGGLALGAFQRVPTHCKDARIGVGTLRGLAPFGVPA